MIPSGTRRSSEALETRPGVQLTCQASVRPGSSTQPADSWNFLLASAMGVHDGLAAGHEIS